MTATGGSDPDAVEPQRPAAGSPDAGADAANQAAVSRNWLRRWRRITQPTPPDIDQGRTRAGDTKVSLLDRNPFQIGFFLTIGAMTAYGLVTAVVSLRSILVLVLLSLAIALGLNPAVTWLHHHGIRRGLAVLMVALGLIILLALAGWALVPVISEQVNKLLTQAPTYLDNLRQNPQIAAFDAQFGVIDKAVSYLTSGDLLGGLFGGLVGAGQAVAGLVFSVVITVVLTLYFLTALPGIKEVIYQLAPASRRPRVRYLANEMFKRVGGYVSGLFTVVLIAMSVAFLFLNVVGLSQYALALMVVVGMFAFVPLVGTTISMIIVSIVAFAFSTTQGLITLAFFLVYQQVDAYFIQPRIFSRSVQIPPILVMLAAVSGALLLGMIGAILAIPITAALLLLYREVLVPHLDRT
ncbi:MAG: AI-2E family transporter [Propionibacteriaceae bacterium]|mgnify:CR=1 FL=1|jgi:predicted PurR-regulated permease PerM|nr:AI-2E family transporter [Propionibacteriaceae bacterium]